MRNPKSLLFATIVRARRAADERQNGASFCIPPISRKNTMVTEPTTFVPVNEIVAALMYAAVLETQRHLDDPALLGVPAVATGMETIQADASWHFRAVAPPHCIEANRVEDAIRGFVYAHPIILQWGQVGIGLSSGSRVHPDDILKSAMAVLRKQPV